ncbi:Transcription elongation factor GreA [Olavius algarvensis spirochete endosymbiont]|uniref:transcription elongation factor GreA n=1 Tax=Olavius algarvensis spirochete endosymbiont TaxID=260710 RepID=UPI000F148F4D|nr:transcription elongation factor GreA [Olavius algarvensis spirochete endosymbiont]VDB00313.1 Transcription elongation factor GreA [Olavius algarvensis spirochete endosymbiont]
MSEEVIKTVSEMLHEEKWTRTSINDFTILDFQTLNDTVKDVLAEGVQDEVQTFCETHLEDNKNAIVALYLSGILSLNKQQVDDTHLLNLVNIFTENYKWGVVEHLCHRILEFGENKVALKNLANTLEHLNQPDKMYEVWERIIKIDYSETDMVKRLAEKREKSGEIDKAITYYRKAIHRYVNKNQFNQVHDIWQKLVEHGVDDYEFFFLIEKKVTKSFGPGKAMNLLEILYPAIKDREEWGTAIKVLKKILNYESRNNWARGEIIHCYKAQYSEHSQIDEYIRLSNLKQNWRNAIEAIADFEKHISFDSGNFVFHNTWGVGIIENIKGNTIKINFAKKRSHSMSLKMAINALRSLSKEHIWVLKSTYSKEQLGAKVKQDISWALKTIIRSFDNAADVKKIKAELVPSILSPSQWSTWSPEARRILKTDSAFGNVPDKIDQFVVRDKPMSFEEKMFNQFKAEKNIFGKIQAVHDFLNHSDPASESFPASEFFAEMFSYFTSFLKLGNVNAQVVASYLFVSKMSTKYPFLNPGLEWGFKELWQDIETPMELFVQLDNAEIRKDFLVSVREEVDNWDRIYLMLFPIQLSSSILDELLSAGFKDAVLKKLELMVEHYREYQDGLIWIARHMEADDWSAELKMNTERILINMIRLLHLTYNEIGNKRDVIYNKKLNRQIHNYLFKEKRLEKFLIGRDMNAATKVFTLLEDIEQLDPVIKRNLKGIVQEAFPEIRFHDDKKKTGVQISSSASRYFFALQSSLNRKQKELKHIVEIEIPRNSKEIGAAIKLGDLSENAEYKSSKERQENLQIQVGKMKEEMDRVRLFAENDWDPGKVGFGTIVTLEDLLGSREEVYTILGPWESNPSERIISYLSPFGRAFIGQSLGSTLEFTINDKNYKFIIKNIQTADLS